MEILIAKLAALGDVLRTTSLLKPLHRRHPGCRLTWITSKQAKPLLEKNPWIQEVCVWPGAQRRLAARRFDLVLSLEEDAGVAAFCGRVCRGSLIGVRTVDGQLSFTESSAPYYSMSLLSRDPDGGHQAADRLKAENRRSYQELWLDILRLPKPARAADLAPVLVLDDKDRQAAARLARRHGLERGAAPIGFNPGAGGRWPAKQISVEHAAAIVDALYRDLGRPVLLLGGKDEARRNAQIVKRARAPAIDAGTGHGLRAFAGIVGLCSLVLSTDSLAFHIATALGKPALVLVGPTSPSELDLFGRGARLLPPGGCSCFYRSECRFASSCLDRLPIANIVRAAKAYLP